MSKGIELLRHLRQTSVSPFVLFVVIHSFLSSSVLRNGDMIYG